MDSDLSQPPTLNPFNDEHLSRMSNVINKSAVLMDWLNRMEAAGIPCDPLKRDCARYANLAKGLKDHFFPNHP